MRLLFTVPWPERLGGAEMMLWNTVRHLDTMRFEPTVVLFGDGPFERELSQLPGVETAVVPVGRLRQLRDLHRSVQDLAELMRLQSPDVIVSWAAKAHVYGACAARAAGLNRPCVWWQHAIPSGHWLERLATVLPARAVGCSSTAAAAAQARLWPRRDVFVVHPGVDPEPALPADLAGLGIPRGRIVIGIVGRLQPWKGQHRLLRALAELSGRGHDVHGLIVGGDAHGLSPDYAPYLRRLIDELQLADRVTLTGQVTDSRPYVAAMDILVNASVGEPFGIVVVEGMAQAVPVVAVADGGVRDILVDGVSGLLVERADEALLASAIERLIVDKGLRVQIGHGGRERFLERFTAAAMTERLEERFELIGGKRSMGPSQALAA